MQQVSVFVDGYNLYHAIHNLGKPHLKWVNLFDLAKEFARSEQGYEIKRVIFFTARPIHKSIEVQQRYSLYIKALMANNIFVIERKFKKKILSYNKDGKNFTRISYEEKESDVNLALAIIEDAFEKISDKILVITNDSDISPSIRMALKKNNSLKISVITPPLIKTKRANYDLIDACGDINKNKAGQIFFKTRMISQDHIERNLMPDIVIAKDGEKIFRPKEYNKK